MSTKKTRQADAEKLVQIMAEVKRGREPWQKVYRERALKILPWICARCGREFTGKKLRELTVHHKDTDHNNNPPDGSNWELLCLYCHDNEHSQYPNEGPPAGAMPGGEQEPPSTYKPFERIL